MRDCRPWDRCSSPAARSRSSSGRGAATSSPARRSARSSVTTASRPDRAIDATRPPLARMRVRAFARRDRRGDRLARRGGLRAGPDRRGARRPVSGVASGTAAGRSVDGSAALERYEAVIGIEVHCQLRTASKMFCGCSTDVRRRAAEHPRLPGLPRPAGRAADDQPAGRRARARDRRSRSRRRSPAAHAAGIARTTSTRTCPKGYQISQYDLPLASHGRLTFDTSRRARSRSASRRAHLEEDTAKLVHATGPDGRQRQPRRLQPLRRAAAWRS